MYPDRKIVFCEYLEAITSRCKETVMKPELQRTFTVRKKRVTTPTCIEPGWWAPLLTTFKVFNNKDLVTFLRRDSTIQHKYSLLHTRTRYKKRTKVFNTGTASYTIANPIDQSAIY